MPQISSSLLDKFAWIGLDCVKEPVSGIVLRFPGLGGGGMKWEPDPAELEWGQSGLLTVVPYQDPWGWMNPNVLHFIDDLVDAVRVKHQIAEKVPLISTGGSMGGHGALLYSVKSRHCVKACMAIWPVCDLPFHYTERVDLPRTMHHAFGYPENIDTLLKEHSPLHLVEAMPDIPYLILHGEKDEAVRKSAHSDLLVAAMRARQLRIEYIERPLLGHGGPMDFEAQRRIIDFVLSQRD